MAHYNLYLDCEKSMQYLTCDDELATIIHYVRSRREQLAGERLIITREEMVALVDM